MPSYLGSVTNFISKTDGNVKLRILISFALSLLFSTVSVIAITTQEPPEYGPAKGAPVIVGGGSLNNTGILEEFVRLAGGADAKYVIVPTAGGNKTPDGKIKIYKEEEVIANWLKRGLKNVHMLHTHDPKVADTEEFVKNLREANAVWFDGGRQWNIVDSYMNTLTYREFHKVLDRGGVIGGEFAGAAVPGGDCRGGGVGGARIRISP